MLFSIYIVHIVYFSFELECEKNENKPKEAGIGPFKNGSSYLGTCMYFRSNVPNSMLYFKKIL